MRSGSVVAPGPVTKLAINRSSSESAKASIQPEATAGQTSGNVMVRNVRNGGEPRSIAASCRLRSNVTSRDCTTTATKQRVSVVCAITMVQKPRSISTATNNRSSDRPVITSGITSGA
jgi:hypothetical protein